MSERRPVRSRGWRTTRAIGGSLDKAGVRAQGAVSAFVVGVHARCATSQFGGVTACSGVAQTGCRSGMGLSDEVGVHARGAASPLGSQSGREDVAGRPDGKHVGSGLTTRGATSLLDGATVGGVVGVGVCAQGATSLPDGVTVGSGSACCSNAVT